MHDIISVGRRVRQQIGLVVDPQHTRYPRDHIGYRGLPILGTLAETPDICKQENIDQIYVALPLEEHVKMLGLVEATNREGVDLHVVPDLLQFIALRARLAEVRQRDDHHAGGREERARQAASWMLRPEAGDRGRKDPPEQVAGDPWYRFRAPGA